MEFSRMTRGSLEKGGMLPPRDCMGAKENTGPWEARHCVGSMHRGYVGVTLARSI